MGVLREYQKQSIAKEFMKEMIDIMKEKYTRFWCDTQIDNIPMQKLLIEFGFKKFATINNFWHNLDYYFWELDLNELR
jgi:ribosomal protein S18 acetylase RimI-like enzyme